MLLYTIMPPDPSHVDEFCEDIRQQYESGVATCALLELTLVPEGDPPVDKAGIYCQTYDLYRDKLQQMGLDCGMLVQASIGHGYPLDHMFPFQRYINLTDGEEQNTCCPYDEGFRAHFRSVMHTLASHRPSVIMVDDDFRLMNRPGKGCACPLHMAAFNRRAGTSMTREELLAHTRGTSDEDRRYTQLFFEIQGESLVGAAKAMREGIDSVNPALPGLFCCCGNGAEYAGDIAQILAGKGNPVVVRVNNGRYTAAGARGLTDSMYRAAIQSTVMKDKVDIFLAETDTCPQNRYSTSAQSLHAHFTGSILEGMGGAKHWITRLGARYEPNSGKAYRRILAMHHGFYEALAALTPQLKWLGCRIPLSKVPGYGFATSPNSAESDGWPLCVLERLGLPMYFSAEPGGAVFMDGPADAKFTDDELREFFKGPVFLASDTAERINNRGFLELTGVEAHEWHGKHASGEKLSVNSNCCSAQYNIFGLVPQNGSVRADSVVYHIPDGKTQEPLFPGVTVYENPLGGTSVIFSGTPKAPYNFMYAFSFLNESRKAQLVRLLKNVGQLPIYYPGDAEVYLRAATMPDGGLFCAVFNIGLDPLEEIELVSERPVEKIERLLPDGTREAVAFTREGDTLTLQTPAYILDPVILFLNN